MKYCFPHPSQRRRARGLIDAAGVICAFVAICAIFAICSSAGVGVAAEQPSPSDRAEQLVQQLGAPSFVARERASQQLEALGEAAESALEEGVRALNREIRYRSLRLLSGIRTRKFNAMLERFLADPESDEEYPLPGWSRFREVVGDSADSRRLFVSMQRSEPELLEALETKPSQVPAMVYTRARSVQQLAGRGIELSLGDVAVLAFVSADDEVDINSTTYNYVSTLMRQAVVRESMSEGARDKPLMTKLLGHWVLKGDGVMIYQSLVLAMQYGLPEGIDVAEKSLRQPAQPSHVKQYAIMAVAKLGDAEHVPLMESLFTDNSLLHQRPVGAKNYSTQVRDLALAAAVHLLDLPLSKVGFKSQTRPAQQMIFNAQELGFANDQDRSAVFARWKEVKQQWRQQHDAETAGATEAAERPMAEPPTEQAP